MTVIERPMNRKERRAAERAKRKAGQKAQGFVVPEVGCWAKSSECDPSTEAGIRAARQSVNEMIQPRLPEIETPRLAQAVGATIDQSTSEPLNMPNVDSYIGGPRTPEGKQISSQNALKHGSCSTSILINSNESLDDFLALEQRWFQSYKPATEGEADLIKAAARAEWFYLRSERNFAEYESQLGSPANWEENQHKTYARFLRYRTANQNILNKSRKAIEDYRKNRQQEAAKAQAIDHANQKLEIAQAKLAIYKEKNKPPLSCGEMLEDMRRKAIELGFRKPDPK